MATALRLALALAVAGCNPGEPPTNRTAEPIVSGEVTGSDPAVVALTTAGRHYCTGTLISPRHVLTAAHCVPPFVEDVRIAQVEIFTGPDVSDVDGGEFIALDTVAFGPWDADASSGDIAIIALERQVAIEPIPVSRTWRPEAGEQLRIVGYGLPTDSPLGGGSGIKREGVATVDYQTSTGVELSSGPSITCSGDSGGPAFAVEDGREVLVAVHSRSDCVSYAYNELARPWLGPLIDPFLANNPEGSCDADGICALGCELPDPDCQCLADGHCIDCEDGWWWDPDCPAECGEDGVCVAEGCAVPDRDCFSCEADGVCEAACGDDPDCDLGASEGQGGCRAGAGASWPGGLALVLGFLFVWCRRRLVDHEIL